MVKVLFDVALLFLITEALTTLLLKFPMLWLNPFKSKIPPLPELYDMITSPVVGNALLVPNTTTPVKAELNLVSPE